MERTQFVIQPLDHALQREFAGGIETEIGRCPAEAVQSCQQCCAQECDWCQTPENPALPEVLRWPGRRARGGNLTGKGCTERPGHARLRELRRNVAGKLLQDEGAEHGYP